MDEIGYIFANTHIMGYVSSNLEEMEKSSGGKSSLLEGRINTVSIHKNILLMF